MIDRKTNQLLFEQDDRSKVSLQHVKKLEHILIALNRAGKPEHMAFPGFHLHPLKGGDDSHDGGNTKHNPQKS